LTRSGGRGRLRGDVRSIIFLAVVLFAAACDKPASGTSAQGSPAPAVAAEAPAPKGTTYGAGVAGDAQVVTVDELLANPKAYEGKTVRVEGMVTDVCPKRGCWMDLAGSKPGQKLRFKVTDGEMTFPMEAKGARAVTQGTVAIQVMTLEESRAYAEYQAKEYGATIDPASITEPTVSVRVDGTGAVVTDKL
jgi:hypothetical protein